MGLLAAWLAVGCACASKDEHKDAQTVRRLRGACERAYRYECRAMLAQVAGADELFAQETPTTATGIEEEPEEVL